MSLFKDMIKNDLNSIFFNQDEFSEIATWNNKQIRIINDKDELLERGKPTASEYTAGIYKNSMLIYTPASDFDNKRPKIGSIITLGKKIYTVQDVTEENDLYSILLKANNAW